MGQLWPAGSRGGGREQEPKLRRTESLLEAHLLVALGCEPARPPLRERVEDLPALSDHLLRRACESMGKPSLKLSRTAQKKLAMHPWPGNVRQLENVLLQAAVMAEGDRIEAEDINVRGVGSASGLLAGRRSFEKEQVQPIVEVLWAHRWNVTKALPELGIPRATLYRLLKRHEILERQRHTSLSKSTGG